MIARYSKCTDVFQNRHKSILQYLAGSGLQLAHNALVEDLKFEQGRYEEDARNYDGLLEKKWTSVVRLQKKVACCSN